MKSSNKIPVRAAYLHQTVQWAGKIGAEKSLAGPRLRGIKMFWTPQGLLMESKGEVCIIPHANVANAILETAPASEE